MGGNMVLRLVAGWSTARCHQSVAGTHRRAEAAGRSAPIPWPKLVEKLSAPRVVWVMVPAGAPTEAVIDELADLLEPGDIIIDGGNSNYKDTMRRAVTLADKGDLLCRCRHQRRRLGPGRGL